MEDGSQAPGQMMTSPFPKTEGAQILFPYLVDRPQEGSLGKGRPTHTERTRSQEDSGSH